MDVLAGTDFLTVEVLTLHGLVTYYVLFFIHLESRRVEVAGIMPHPNVLLFPTVKAKAESGDSPVRCGERLGGLLKYYHREAS